MLQAFWRHLVLFDSGCCSSGFLLVVLDVERAEHVGEESGIEGQEGGNRFGEGTAGLELNLQGVHKDDQELNLEMGIEELLSC